VIDIGRREGQGRDTYAHRSSNFTRWVLQTINFLLFGFLRSKNCLVQVFLLIYYFWNFPAPALLLLCSYI
jgi:hypothetical protein